MSERVSNLGRWALVPFAPFLFVLIFLRTVWEEGRPEWRNGIANSAMAVILFSLGMTCVAGLKPF